MEKSCIKLANCLKDFLKGLTGCLLGFISKIFIESIVAIFCVASIFYFLSMGFPEIYRWASRWANQPLLPIANSCNIIESSFEHGEEISNMRKFKVMVAFDTIVKSNKQLLIYDPTGHIEIQKNKKDNKRQSFQFMKGTGNSVINFNILAEKDTIRTGDLEYEECPFKIQYIDD